MRESRANRYVRQLPAGVLQLCGHDQDYRTIGLRVMHSFTSTIMMATAAIAWLKKELKAA
jgi:hypothetical protein